MTVDAYALTSLTAVKAYLNVSGSGDDTLIEDCVDAASEAIETWLDKRILSRTYTEIHDPRGCDHVVLRNKPVTSIAAIGFGVRPCMSVALDGTSGIVNATFEVMPPSTGGGVAVLKLNYYGASGSVNTQSSSTQKSVSALVTSFNSSPWVVAQMGDDIRLEFLHASGPIDVKGGTGYATCPLRLDGQCRADYPKGIIHRTSAWGAYCDPEWDDDEWPSGWAPSLGVTPQSLTVVYTAGEGTTPYDIEFTARKAAALLFRERKRDLGASSESLGDYSYVNAASANGGSALMDLIEAELGGRKRLR